MASYVMMLAASLALPVSLPSGHCRSYLPPGPAACRVSVPRLGGILSCQFYYWLLNTAGREARARGCLVATCQGQRPGWASL